MRSVSLGILLTLVTIVSVLPVAAPTNFTVGLSPLVICLSDNGNFCPTSAGFTVNVGPSNGFTGTVALTTTYSAIFCSGSNTNPLPPPLFTAALVTLSGGSVQVTLTFSTLPNTSTICVYSVIVTGLGGGSAGVSNTVYILVLP